MNFLRLFWYTHLPVVVVVTLLVCSGCSSKSAQIPLENTAASHLGKLLFHDRRLSANGDVSCSSCHDPALSFTDGKSVAIGTLGREGTRNAPSLLDLNDLTSFFWDGREAELHDVVLQPFTNTVEMGLPDTSTLVQRIRALPEYSDLIGNTPEDFIEDRKAVATAIVTYLRSLPKASSRASRSIRSGEHSALDADEMAGLALFTGKAECSTCHTIRGTDMPLTDNRFHHTGVGFENIAGNLAAMLTQLEVLDRNGDLVGNAILTNRNISELGRFAFSRQSSDLGAFRTPSLRNVAMTAPYMHDGSVPTLQDAVERELYYRGLARGRPISLTVEEQRQLLAFLNALTDQLGSHP
jgi:cytochrome c peroxidase